MESKEPRGEIENPYAPPLVDSENREAIDSTTPIRRDGDLVIVTHGSVLPRRCVVCNQPSFKVQSRSLAGSPTLIRAEWVILLPLLSVPAMFLAVRLVGVRLAIGIVPLMLFLIFVAVIGPRFFGGRTRIHYSICRSHWWSTLATQSLVWVGIACVGCGVLVVNQALSGRSLAGWFGILLLASGFALAIVRVFTAFYSFLPKVQRRQGAHIWVSGFGRGFLASLPTVAAENPDAQSSGSSQST